jgi:hypothetical protein
VNWRDLLGYDGAQLKAMTDAQLNELFAPCLNITRPDRAPRMDTKKPNQSALAKAKTAKANDLLGQLGFDIEL